MFKLLESIFGKSPDTTKKVDAGVIRRATDRLVQGTDPRMVAVGRYREKLRPAVERAVEYVIELVDSLAPPADLARTQYLADLRLRAFFASVDHMRETIASSRDIRAFLRQRGGVPFEPVYALLGVRYQERRTLGMELDGEHLRRDVLQQVVEFRGHQFFAPSTEEDTTRRELMRLAYDDLVSVALTRIVAVRKQHDSAKRERRLLDKKLRCLHDGRLGMRAAIEAVPQADPVAVEEEIARIEVELAKAPTESATLEDYLELSAQTLSTPDAYISLQPISLTLDEMGRKVEEGSSSSASTLSLQEVTVSDGERAIALLARIDPSEITPPKDFAKEARRYLG